MSFHVERDPLLDAVCLVESNFFDDDRGWFSEFFRSSAFEEAGLPAEFDQVNRSFSKRSVALRGLHLQVPPSAQGKFVCCPRGAIFDVAVDVSHGSPTFGRWTSYRLDETNRRALWVPAGFAHGFQTLIDDTEVMYLTTTEYAPECERSISWNDPDIRIEWPIGPPILSLKDSEAPNLREADLE